MLKSLKNIFNKRSNGNKPPDTSRVSKLCDPNAIVAIIGVVPEGEPNPPMDKIDFVLNVFKQTNPELCQAFIASNNKNAKTHYLASPRIDPTTGTMDPKEWPVVLDYLGYPQACILYVQTLVLQNVRPKHVHLFTVCKSREPINVVVAGPLGPSTSSQ